MARRLARVLNRFRWVLSRVRGTGRTVQHVQSLYDSRGYLLSELDSLTWDDLLYGRVHRQQQKVLLNDEVVLGSAKETRQLVLHELSSIIESRQLKTGATVVEFGCGDGRNLFYLKKQFPEVRFAGFELSPASVEYARQVSMKFNLDVDFRTCDITDSLPSDYDFSGVSIVYKMHAVEQMPKGYDRAIRHMLTATSDRLVLLEPIRELWPLNSRGLRARLHNWWKHYVSGVMPLLNELEKEGHLSMLTAHRLGYAGNPLNETCIIELSVTNHTSDRLLLQ